MQNPDEKLLAAVPTLAKLVERSEAKIKSFRRYVIEGEGRDGYRKEVGAIVVQGDGSLKCTGKAIPPSEEEAAAIKAEIAATAAWPVSQGTGPKALPDELRNVPHEDIFRFLSADGEKTLFIQHQEKKDGIKEYWPWSFWSDGKWRKMEPDGLLPLYGLDGIDNHPTVFMHEGAGAARYCQWLTKAETFSAKEALGAHPWGKEISIAPHLGWVGGAMNPHRTDWSALRRLGVKRLFIVADNDFVGKEAIPKIAKRTLLLETAIEFDDRFKRGFDLGDPWPNAKERPDFWRGDRYIGPSFHEMMVPATWATKKIETGKKGRPLYQLRSDFVQQWTFSNKPQLFVHRDFPHIMFTAEEFNKKVAPFTEGGDVASLLAKHSAAQKDGLTYQPQSVHTFARIITKDGERKINTYRPPTIKPGPGSALPFLKFMTRVFPNKRDRFLVLRWCATLIARPEIRMRYSLLLISERQGTGKSTLGTILRALVGPWNVSMPTEHAITKSEFNSWRAHKRLAIVNEIYSGHDGKCYERLKEVLTEDDFDVNKKHVDSYSLDNFLHLFACSNSLQAIKLEDEDRRFLVPLVTEDLQPDGYWGSFYSWIGGGGLSAVAAWAERFVMKHGPVPTGEHAPITDRKKEVLAEGRSEGAKLAYDLAEFACQPDAAGKLKKVVLRVDEVRVWVATQRGIDVNSPKIESLAKLRKAMERAGMTRPKGADGRPRRMTIARFPVEVVANFVIEPNTSWDALPVDVKPKPGELLLPPLGATGNKN